MGKMELDFSIPNAYPERRLSAMYIGRQMTSEFGCVNLRHLKFRVTVMVYASDLLMPDGTPSKHHEQFCYLHSQRYIVRCRFNPQEEKEDSPKFHDIGDWALDTVMPFVQHMESAFKDVPFGRLVDWLHPPTFALRLFLEGDALTYMQCPRDKSVEEESFGHYGTRFDEAIVKKAHLAGIPVYDCEELSIDDRSCLQDGAVLGHPTVVRLISRPSRSFYLRLVKFPPAFQTELNAYLELAIQDPCQDLNIPRLQGLLRSRSTQWGRVWLQGMLLERVDVESRLDRAVGYPLEVREQWCQQIEKTVRRLHDFGLIWGDAAAENILIDKKERAWIVDLEGGYRAKWIDHQLAESKAGDLQALGRLLLWIRWGPPSEQPSPSGNGARNDYNGQLLRRASM